MLSENRRDFFRRAAALAASTGIGGAVLAGCGKQAAEGETAQVTPAADGPKAASKGAGSAPEETMGGPSGGGARVGREPEPGQAGPEGQTGGPTQGDQPAGGASGRAAGQVIVAKGGDSPAALVRAAVEALGGMGTFVRAGQSVCIKPNASWDRGPGSGANTHPEALAEVVRMCKAAGAREVIAVDYTLASNPLEWNGLSEAAESAGGKFIELREGNKDMFDEVEFLPGLRALPGIGPKERVAYDVLASDVLINMPVLKSHSATGLSVGMKNLMGVIFDRRRYHGGGSGEMTDVATQKAAILDQAIADLGLLLSGKVNLTVVDASYVMRSDSGPRGRDEEDGDPVMQAIAGTDIVACDAVAARIYGLSDDQMRTKAAHIPLAAELGFGTMDTNALARFEEVRA